MPKKLQQRRLILQMRIQKFSWLLFFCKIFLRFLKLKNFAVPPDDPGVKSTILSGNYVFNTMNINMFCTVYTHQYNIHDINVAVWKSFIQYELG